MKLICLIILLSNCTGVFCQSTATEIFFSQFKNGVYADLTKSAFYIIDSIENLQCIHFKNLAADDTILTKEDADYISAQMEVPVQDVWTTTLFKHAKIKTLKEMTELEKQNTTITSSIAYFVLSLPYFNKEEDVCVILYQFQCGRLCAERSLRLYKKMNGKWKHVKNYSFSVS